jgi:restriction endonuclease S subunit
VRISSITRLNIGAKIFRIDIVETNEENMLCPYILPLSTEVLESVLKQEVLRSAYISKVIYSTVGNIFVFRTHANVTEKSAMVLRKDKQIAEVCYSRNII